MSPTLNGHLVNAPTVSRKSRGPFGNMFLQNVGNCTLSVQMKNGKLSVSCAIVVLVV